MHDLRTKEADLTEGQTDRSLRWGGLSGILGSLLMVGSGASNAEVAASLFMSEATVKAHVSRLLTKLEVTNRVHIAILVHDAQP